MQSVYAEPTGTSKGFDTVNLEIFARILFSRVVLKAYLARKKNRDFDMIKDKEFSLFREEFIFAKLRMREVSRK